MTKYIFILLALFSFWGCQDAVLSPNNVAIVSDSEIVIPPKPPVARFPFKLGSNWTYNVYQFYQNGEISNSVSDSIYEEVVAVDSSNFENRKIDVYSVSVRSLSDNRRQYIKKYFWLTDTLYEFIDYYRPVLIYPLSVGKKWKTTYYDYQFRDSVYTESVNVASISNINVESKPIRNAFLIKYSSYDKKGVYIGEEDSYFSYDIGYIQSIDYSYFHQKYFGFPAALRLKSYKIVTN